MKAIRQNRVRMKLKRSLLPRLVVFRSNRRISAQIIDPGGKVLAASTTSITPRVQSAHALGETLAAAALQKKVTRVVFDRGAYAYHGSVKALAEGARKAGLQF